MTHESLINDAYSHIINILSTTHPSSETILKLGILNKMALERALELDAVEPSYPQLQSTLPEVSFRKTRKPVARLPEDLIGEVISTT